MLAWLQLMQVTDPKSLQNTSQDEGIPFESLIIATKSTDSFNLGRLK